MTYERGNRSISILTTDKKTKWQKPLSSENSSENESQTSEDFADVVSHTSYCFCYRDMLATHVRMWVQLFSLNNRIPVQSSFGSASGHRIVAILPSVITAGNQLLI